MSPRILKNKKLIFKNEFKMSFLCLFLINLNTNAQVGINNTNPSATIEISASNLSNPSNTDGILIPRVNSFPLINPGELQHSMIVYLVNTDGSKNSGFYFWDDNRNNWIAMGADSDTKIEYINELNDAKSDVDGSENGSSIFLGINAGANDDSSDNKNIGIGYNSLNAVTTGLNNVAVGYQALLSNNGNGNVSIGRESLASNTTGNYNVAIGLSALENNDGVHGNTAIGYQAMKLNTTGTGNTAIGSYALDANLTGTNNMAIGTFSLSKHTQGNGNTAVGPYALAQYPGASGNNGNTAIGNLSVNKLTSGTGNTGIGFESMRFTTTGSSNTVIGHFAGFHAGRDGTSVSNNTFIGKSAGFAANGNQNTYIGASAGGTGGNNNFRTGSGNIFIGYQAGNNETFGDTDNQLVIANSNTTTPLIYGEFDNDLVRINGTSEADDYKLTALNSKPSNSSDSCSVGEIRYAKDGSKYYIYLCVSSNTWRRSELKGF